MAISASDLGGAQSSSSRARRGQELRRLASREPPLIQHQGKTLRKIDPLEAAKAVMKKAMASKLEMEKKEQEDKAKKENYKAKLEISKKEMTEQKKKEDKKKIQYYAELKLIKENKAKIAIERKMRKQKMESSLPVVQEGQGEASAEKEIPRQVNPVKIENPSQHGVPEQQVQPTNTNTGEKKEEEEEKARFLDSFDLIEKLGVGAFGTVFKARRKEDNSIVALKILDKSKLKKQGVLKMVKNEVKIMSILSGQRNMLTFHGAYHDNEKIYIVMEYCEGGNLHAMCKSRHRNFTDNEKRFLIKQILAAVHISHCNNVIHRDIKFENFVFATKGDMSSLRLIDFGLSGFFMPGEKLKDLFGTRGHIAPEVFDGISGFASDLWSVGVMAYTLLVNKYPFDTPMDNPDVNSWRPDYTEGPDFSLHTWCCVPIEARNFVKRLLHPDPAKRLTMIKALQHKYLRA